MKLATRILLLLTLTIGTAFAQSTPQNLINDVLFENFQLNSFEKGIKESRNKCHFESDNYSLTIEYCSKSKRLNFVKKGIFKNKFTGEGFSLYLENNDNSIITPNTLYMYGQTYSNEKPKLFQYVQAFGPDKGSIWESEVKALKNSNELKEFIDLIFNLINNNL